MGWDFFPEKHPQKQVAGTRLPVMWSYDVSLVVYYMLYCCSPPENWQEGLLASEAINPLMTTDLKIYHAALATCYQLVPSVLSSVLVERVG